MKKPRKTSPAGRRITHKGSILLVVVALLMLLALMGTAWLATTRGDRRASVNNVANVQMELLAKGVCNLATSQIVDGLSGRPLSAANNSKLVYRPWTFLDPVDNTNPNQSTFVNFDWVVTSATPNSLLPAGRNWLASRVPTTGAVWPAITAALGSRQTNMTPTVDSQRLFESPYISNNGDGTYTSRTSITAASVTITAADGTIRIFPAFRIGGALYLAADTDGDGIADAGLWRLPLGEQNGITYYAAVRIIDNNSAVNLSVASKPVESGDIPASPLANFYPDIFPSNIDLYRMLRNPTQLAWLNVYRFGNDLLVDPTKSPTTANMQQTPNIQFGMYDDVANAIRNDAQFLSAYDALWHQVGMRVDNPGMNQGGQRFRAIPIDEQNSLARGFVLAPPTASADLYKRSELERRLYSTILNLDNTDTNLVPSLQYSPSSTAKWFSDNFNYAVMAGAANDVYSRRALLVARNGVVQAIPDVGALANANFANPVIASTDPSYPSLQLTADTNPGSNDVTGGLPTKVSLNTGNFKELWRAFWHVMADRIDQPTDNTPFNNGTDPSTLANQGYLGMAFDPTSGAITPESNQWRMFRSSLRPGGEKDPAKLLLLPSQQLLLRAAIAAANAIELRWGPMSGTGSNIFQRYLNSNSLNSLLPANNADVAVNQNISDISIKLKDGTQATARVFGNKPQPFIAEVYANNDGAMHQGQQPTQPAPPAAPLPAVPPFYRNPNGFVAITLHNPYTASELNGPMNIGNWQLVTVKRNTTNGASSISTSATVIYTFPAGTTIPTATGTDRPGMLTLWNFNASARGDDQNPANPKSFYPADLTQDADGAGLGSFPPKEVTYPSPQADGTHGPFLNTGATTIYVPNLGVVMGTNTTTDPAKELILVRPQIPTNTPGGDPRNPAYWGTAVPVDSFDFTGMPPVSSDPTATFTAWIYRRNCNILTSGGKTYSEFRCVYPGRYDGRKTTKRQQGTFDRTFTIDSATGKTKAIGGLFTGNQRPLFDYPLTAGGAYPATYTTGNAGLPFRIPIAVEDSPGPFGKGKTSGASFYYPFGGFARNLDVMQVPFIGAYVIFDGNNIDEINPITMDAAFAEDTDETNDDREQVGRFVPIMGSTVGTADDWAQLANKTAWRYRWAMKAMDFLCVDLPAKDFLPGATNEYVQGLYGASNPMPVYNTSASNTARPANALLANKAENGVGIEGQINLNTAPIPVLATIPFAKAADGTINRTSNLTIAKAIAAYRDANGPFTNLFDLYRVSTFKALSDSDLAVSRAGTKYGDGMLLPGPAAGGAASPGIYGIQNDFNERYLALNRISNMVTLRSDTFTVYVLVQGWRNAGTSQPVLAAQRRVAFIVDRTAITGGTAPNRLPSITNVPPQD